MTPRSSSLRMRSKTAEGARPTWRAISALERRASCWRRVRIFSLMSSIMGWPALEACGLVLRLGTQLAVVAQTEEEADRRQIARVAPGEQVLVEAKPQARGDIHQRIRLAAPRATSVERGEKALGVRRRVRAWREHCVETIGFHSLRPDSSTPNDMR